MRFSPLLLLLLLFLRVCIILISFLFYDQRLELLLPLLCCTPQQTTPTDCSHRGVQESQKVPFNRQVDCLRVATFKYTHFNVFRREKKKRDSFALSTLLHFKSFSFYCTYNSGISLCGSSSSSSVFDESLMTHSKNK